jgi:hypothetical protein
MAEEGTLSIVRRGPIYHVRYASNDPYGIDRQPYLCPDEAHLHTLLHQCRLEPWALQRACAELQRGGVTVLCVVFADRDVSRLFPLPDKQQGGSQDAKDADQHADAA